MTQPLHLARARAAAAAATATLLALTFAGPAAADPPDGATEPPGNRGTVKIHEVGTSDDDNRNEPHVCDFRIAGFGFPADAVLTISIAGHGGPNAGAGTFEASVAPSGLSATGDWAIDGPTLPDGMYKLEVENSTAPGGAKQKVFHVDCPDAPPTVGGEVVSPPAPEAPPVFEAPADVDDGSTEAPAVPAAPAAPEGSGATSATGTPGVTAGAVVSPLQAEVLAAAAARQPVRTDVLGVQTTRSPARASSGSALAYTGTTVGGLALLGAAAIAVGVLLHRRSTLRGA